MLGFPTFYFNFNNDTFIIITESPHVGSTGFGTISKGRILTSDRMVICFIKFNIIVRHHIDFMDSSL